MAGAQFAVDIRQAEDPEGLPLAGRRMAFGPSGIDQVEFLVAPNKGEGLKPLAKIASGGETSRLMLGLKSVLAEADRRPTLIFDEIDQGIGGRTGGVVGRKLWGLARQHQVLCVTHLPQLAAHGERHFKVAKATVAGRTLAKVTEMRGAARTQELAGMLGEESESNLRSAEALLQGAAAELS
jgi:DNA repair protein RecN (Recombination protein N)